jgi:hypothetical protein
MENIIDIFKGAGYSMKDYSNRKRVIRELNYVMSLGVAIQIAPAGRVWTDSKDNYKYNVIVKGFGYRSRGYYKYVEPIDALKTCANLLQVKEVKEKVFATITNPVVCPKCEGKGFIPQFDYYANGVCFQCGGTGYLGSTSIKARKPIVEIRVDPKTITDINTLCRIIFVNDKPNLVEGVRQEAFDQAMKLGYLTKVKGEFFKGGDYGEFFESDFAYKWNSKLRFNEAWYSEDLKTFFVGII